MLPAHALWSARHGKLAAADPIPGGDAIVMLSRGSEGLSDDGMSNPGDPEPPAYVLGWWEERWRTDLGLASLRPAWQRRADRTLTQAYVFLDTHLSTAAQQLAGFAQFARSLSDMRRHLESLLSAGDAPIRGVQCFRCRQTLEREYRNPVECRHVLEAHRAGLGYAEWLRTLASYPVLAGEHASCDQGGLLDPDPVVGWHCPRCRRTYSPGEYALALKAAADEHAEALPATELAVRLGVSAATVWSWAHRGFVRRRGRGADRRTLYDVADALRHAEISMSQTVAV